jgi:transposase
MRVETSYKTVVLQLNPDYDTQKELHRSMMGVNRFLKMSRANVQKLLYYRWKALNESYPGRSIALMVQRFSNFSDKEFTVFNSDNSKFIFDKEWFVEVQVRTKDGNKLVPRIRIPVSRTEVPYYADIQDMVGLPMMVVKENDKYFAYVQIKQEITHSETVVGVDFNFRKWVVSAVDGQPLFFDAEPYALEIEGISKMISRFRSRLDAEKDANKIAVLEQKINELYAQQTAAVKRAHGNFLAAIEKKFGRCTLAVEDPKIMFRLKEKESGMTNNWLYKKTALSQFQLRAMAHGFEVASVNPAYTSKVCHKCNHLGKIDGKNSRIFSCPHCGLKNYHRDLNAARNIAKVFFGIFAKIEDIRQEIKDAKDVKNAKKDQTYSSDEPLNRSVTF